VNFARRVVTPSLFLIIFAPASEENRGWDGGRAVDVKKIVLLGLAGVVLVVGIVSVVVARHWPFSQERVRQSLQSTFPATVAFQRFHSTYVPHPGCIAEGVAFTRLGATPGTPPIVTIQRFTIRAHYVDLFFRPGYLAAIVLDGLRLEIPPLGTPVRESNLQETKSSTRVGEIVADDSSLQIDRSSRDESLLFAIHTLRLYSVSDKQPASFTVSLHIPLPPGDVRARGQFGPWNYNDPGQTPVAGEYTLQNADLGVFPGIAGILSAQDKFQGVLGHIDSQGSIDIPNFMVTRSQHSVHLQSEFHATVNGTNGDVQLDRVNAAFLKTMVVGKGEVAHHAGQEGKVTSVDLSVHHGRIQDVLWLFVCEANPPLHGSGNFRARVIIPPGDAPFLHKVRLIGDFGIEDGQFAKAGTQARVDTLSQKALGEKVGNDSDASDPGRVISELAGHVELREATATFKNFRFAVPGATAEMHGTYNLESRAVNLHGTLRTEEEFSEMTSGFKAVVLRPFDVFFRRKHAGSEMPVHLIGTYDDPEAGLDLPAKKASGMKP
jgi:AsmA-like C-terminal region